MSVYNDYMIKLGSGITYKATQYSNLVQQGIEDCCLKRQIQLLTMYWELLTTVTADDCIDDDQIVAIVEHITCLLGTGIGSLTAADILSSAPGTSPGAISVTAVVGNDEVADVQVLDTGTHVIAFEIDSVAVDLGTDVNGLDYALSCAAWAQATGLGEPYTLSLRSESGFSVQIYSDGTVFEYKAKLKT